MSYLHYFFFSISGFSLCPLVGSSVTLPLRHDVLQTLQQHVWATAVLWTRPLTGWVARWWHHYISFHSEGPLPAYTALPDHLVDVWQLLGWAAVNPVSVGVWCEAACGVLMRGNVQRVPLGNTTGGERLSSYWRERRERRSVRPIIMGGVSQCEALHLQDIHTVVELDEVTTFLLSWLVRICVSWRLTSFLCRLSPRHRIHLHVFISWLLSGRTTQ